MPQYVILSEAKNLKGRYGDAVDCRYSVEILRSRVFPQDDREWRKSFVCGGMKGASNNHTASQRSGCGVKRRNDEKDELSSRMTEAKDMKTIPTRRGGGGWNRSAKEESPLSLRDIPPLTRGA